MIRISVIACLVVVAAPFARAEGPAPEAVDAALNKMVALDPAQVAAKVKEYKAKVAELDAQSKKLKDDAAAADENAKVLDARIQSAVAVAEALVKSEAAREKMMAPAMPAAPEGTPSMAPKMVQAKAEAPAKPDVTFEGHVADIFEQRCMRCHNEDKQKGGLSLDTMGALMTGGASGEVIKVGDPDGSRLFRLINGTEEPKMPPSGDPLSPEQLDIIRKWIQLGAPETADSEILVAEAIEMDASNAFVAAEIVDGPPPMPEVALAAAKSNGDVGVVARAVATSPQSSLAAVGGDRQILLYNLDDLSLIGALPFPEGDVFELSFTVNGELLLAAGGHEGDSGYAVVWHVRTGERIGSFGKDYDTVLAADISPDHRMIAVGGTNKKVKVLSMADGSLLYEIEKHSNWITAVKFTPDGEVLATADRASNMFLWQAANGRPVEQLRGHSGAIRDLVYSPDSKLLASASEDGTVRLWDTWKYNQVRSINAHGGGVLSVDFDVQGRLVSTGVDGLAKRWGTDGAEQKAYEKLPDWGYSARFGKQGAHVLAGSWTGDIWVWDAESGERLGEFHTSPVPVSTGADEAMTAALESS
jgi:mono/diheme cytochrome c family protein